jgi:hypothetical protein
MLFVWGPLPERLLPPWNAAQAVRARRVLLLSRVGLGLLLLEFLFQLVGAV